jgi:acetoin utilization protein AcuC
VRAYRPDVVFAQLGIDTHFRDPLTHLQLTTQGFTEAVRKLQTLGREFGPFVAVGGGGYDMGAVARAWTMAMAEMAGFDLPERVPESYSEVPGLTTFADNPGPTPLPPDTARQVEEYAEQTMEEVKQTFFTKFGIG